MSTIRSVVIECDGHGCKRKYGPESHATAEGLRAKARAFGWATRVSIGILVGGAEAHTVGDFCPKCRRKKNG